MTDPRPTRAAIIGAGLMGRWHADAVRKTGGQVVAVIDRNPEVAQRLAASHPGAASFSDLAELIRQGEAEVLHVCTPLPTHENLARLALDNDLHVLVEKPLTPTGLETEGLYDLAEQNGLLVCPVHQFVFQEGILRAKGWLASIGDVLHLKGVFHSAGAAGGIPPDEIVADILPHPLSLMQVFLPSGLSQTAWHTQRTRPGDLYALSDFGGVTASISISMNARPTVAAFQVVGTQGTIQLDLYHGYGLREVGEVSRRRKILHPFTFAGAQLGAASANLLRRTLRAEPAYPGLRKLIAQFYRAVRQEGAPPISRQEGVMVARARDWLLGVGQAL